MRKIYDYKDIRLLEENPINNLIKNGIVITATSELKTAMAAYYPAYKVFDIHTFISEIIPEWEGNVKELKNYVFLRNVIEDYVNDNEVRDEVATYLRRNTGDMWNAIKLLIEADVYPDDVVSNSSEPIEHFKEIWKKLELNNDQIITFKSIFTYGLSQKNEVIDRIKNIVEDIPEDLFLFGFYFITPIQDRIFDILEDSGFKLFFLNCHDYRYKHATMIWEKTFSQYCEDEIQDIQKDIKLDNFFGEALDGNKENIPIEVTKHYTEFDFAEMVKNAVDRGEIVYSPDAKQCDQILKEYYPEYYDQKHFLSYPVGQYIYYLHMMWNSFRNTMDMQFEYVYKCFASGWLSNDELNGRDLLYELKVLEPYFKFNHEVHTIEDWENRLKALIECRHTVSSFDDREKGSERWHKLQGNPFYNMGVYTVEEEKILDIKSLILKLIKDAKYLFEEQEKTDLFEHFQKIKQIINQHMDKDDLLEEEAEIANELIQQLSDETTRGIECPMNGIRDAIIMLIGDHFGEYETQEEETSDRQRMVLPISMVEAAMLNNYGQTVHLVLANEFALPGQPKNLPWPITNKMLDSLDIEGRERTQKYVTDMRSVISNRPLSYRYLYFTFMGISNSENKPKLSVEWVCKKENKDIDVSSYIKLLNLGEDNMTNIISKSSDFTTMIEASDVKYKEDNLDLPDPSFPEEVRMDYLLCHERYIYSYLLNYIPSYTSEFHYGFELSKLISAFSIVSGIDKEVVSRNIGELFPFLRNIELRQSTDFAKSQGKPEPFIYEGVEYPGQRYLTHFINDEVIREARSRNDAFMSGENINKDISKNMCIYCPYSNICMTRHRKEVALYE